jgi:hypothetical protein
MRDYDTPITRIESLPEMQTAIQQELARARARHGFKEAGPEGKARAIRERHLAHYVLAHYFDQPEGVRDAILEEGRRIMEERRKSPAPIYWPILGAGEAEAQPGTLSGHGPGPLAKAVGPGEGNKTG